MSQYKKLYCDMRTDGWEVRSGLVGWACYDTVGCIVTREQGIWQRIVSQYRATTRCRGVPATWLLGL